MQKATEEEKLALINKVSSTCCVCFVKGQVARVADALRSMCLLNLSRFAFCNPQGVVGPATSC